MAILSIISAMSKNGVIGVDNKLPWKNKADMKLFKERTSGSTVIMGRLTYESLNRPLKNRENIVISSSDLKNVIRCSSIPEAISKASNDNIFFIGGAKIFEEAFLYSTILYRTVFNFTIEAENAVYFPTIPETFICSEKRILDEMILEKWLNSTI